MIDRLCSCTVAGILRSLQVSNIVAISVIATLSSCSAPTTRQFVVEASAIDKVPDSLVAVEDGRGRFREIFCGVLDSRQSELPDYQDCDVALTHVEDEKGGSGAPVDLAPSKSNLTVYFVPGIGWDCFSQWLAPPKTAVKHIRQRGYGFEAVPIESLSSSSRNARIIRDTVMRSPKSATGSRAVLVGYSKGAPDILEAVVAYPELASRVAAVVSVAGAIWGSPLAEDVAFANLAPIRNWPGAKCAAGDGGGLESLLPRERAEWMAENQLPASIQYYSIAALPHPDNISAILRPSYAKLSKSDRRNDSQVLLFDQFIPGSTFLGYLNADHWALALPIERSHRLIGKTIVNRNSYPREALLEAILRNVEEDIAK
ncbi:hypothetical protein [Ruegeria atlantica]|uniref:hypothetical protein n=1 Tax=Ruegeria atlantica TaxID=81569 RepID=UPI000AB16A60|nr:hypothetical protein [Ruegeria atlantica]